MRVDILEYQWTPEYSHGYVAREARYWTRSTSWLKVFLLSVFLRCTFTVRANWCMYFQHKTSPMPSSVPCSKKAGTKRMRRMSGRSPFQWTRHNTCLDVSVMGSPFQQRRVINGF